MIITRTTIVKMVMVLGEQKGCRISRYRRFLGLGSLVR
jgi:hypothetical protein